VGIKMLIGSALTFASFIIPIIPGMPGCCSEISDQLAADGY